MDAPQKYISEAVRRQYHLAVVEKKDEVIAKLEAEVRRLRDERARILDEAAERATEWWYSGDESAKRGVDPELDKLADELRAAVRGEVEK